MKKKTIKQKSPAVAFGHAGGSATFKKIGRKGMSLIGKKGALARWKKAKKSK